MSNKLITVFGATGLQGGSVARALLNGGQFKVRAVTRSPGSDTAKCLVKNGAEVVHADLDDKASVVSSLQGAYGCYGVTNFWAHLDASKEIKQGKDLADACKEAGVQHYVYSGLENAKSFTGLSAPHFDSKGMVEEYLQGLDTPHTIVRIAGYCEIFLSQMPAQKIGDNKYGLLIPMADKPMYLVPVKEIGECVHQIFLQPDKYLGKCIGLSSDFLTCEQMAEIMTQELGTTVIDGKITNEAYAKLGFPGAEDLSNMFTFYQSGKCFRDVELTKKLNPSISTFTQWVKNNKEGLKAVMKL